MQNKIKILVRISASITNVCFFFDILAFSFFSLCFLFLISTIEDSLLFV